MVGMSPTYCGECNSTFEGLLPRCTGLPTAVRKLHDHCLSVSTARLTTQRFPVINAHLSKTSISLITLGLCL